MSSDSNTKYIILVPDGMADAPNPKENGSTPLKSAKTPWMDKMAQCGELGQTRTIPEGMDPGSDVANLAIMGYSPKDVYTGRAPFEAASMGVNLREKDLAFRLNFVTLDRNFTEMADNSADHISSEEAKELVKAIAPIAEGLGLTIYPGVSYRNLLVWKNGPRNCVTHPPHDFLGESVYTKMPSGEGADVLIRFMIASWRVLEEHPVNKIRMQRCLGPGNSVWPWGQGFAPKLTKISERFNITGAVVAAVDLVRGIGKYAGLQIIDVPGATGYLDTNYAGKVEAALSQLKDKDFVFLHVEAPDEAGHSGQEKLKIQAIEDFDEKVVGPILQGMKEFPHWRVLLMPDHRTPVAIRTHTSDPIPYILLDSKDWDENTSAQKFSEDAAENSGKMVEDGSKMIELLLNKAS